MDTRRLSYGKLGHSADTFWAKDSSQMTPGNDRLQEHIDAEQLTFTHEPDEGGLVAAAKRNAARQAILNQGKPGEKLDIHRLLKNPLKEAELFLSCPLQ